MSRILLGFILGSVIGGVSAWGWDVEQQSNEMRHQQNEQQLLNMQRQHMQEEQMDRLERRNPC